jgi:hypothetical protein
MNNKQSQLNTKYRHTTAGHHRSITPVTANSNNVACVRRAMARNTASMSSNEQHANPSMNTVNVNTEQCHNGTTNHQQTTVISTTTGNQQHNFVFNVTRIPQS